MNKERPILRFEFVGMLFALAIGQVAIEFVSILKTPISFDHWYYSFSHLTLATGVIALSWIGWQSSKSIGNTVTIDSIFSIPFIVLLLDITLVIFYYLLVNGNEKYITDLHVYEEPSVYSETKWVMRIFVVYLLWDVITKLIHINYKKVKGKKYTYLKHYEITFKSIKRLIITTVCLIIAIYFFYMYKGREVNDLQTLIVDINLLLVFIIFRAFKQPYVEKYTLNETQIPDSIIYESGIKFREKNGLISVIDIKSRLEFKKIVFRVVPVVALVLLEILNHTCFV